MTVAKQGRSAKKPASPAVPARRAKPAAKPRAAKPSRIDEAAEAKAECARVAAEAAVRVAQATAHGPGAKSAPIPYGPEISQAILDRVAAGESVRSITRDPAMPSSAAVFNWLKAHPEFAEAYGAAKETGLELMADELLDIADDGTNDWMERYTRGGGMYLVTNDEAIQRSKVRIETRKWLLERLAAKKYAPTSSVTHKGAIGVAPLEVEPEHARRIAQTILDGMPSAVQEGGK